MDTTTETWAQLRADAWNRKCGEVKNLAYALQSNPVVALAADLSGYGEGGWHSSAGELLEPDAVALALYAWYAARDLPEPATHVLHTEAARISATSVPAAAGRSKYRALSNLAGSLQHAWSADTSADPENYSERREASYGQCAVTALLVQQVAGGDLLRVVVTDQVGAGWSKKSVEVSHYFNLLPDGTEVDLTRGQFTRFAYGENVTEPEVRSREYVLSHPATAERYTILASRVELPYLA